MNADPSELVNCAVTGCLSNATLTQLSAELWQIATCVGAACP